MREQIEVVNVRNAVAALRSNVQLIPASEVISVIGQLAEIEAIAKTRLVETISKQYRGEDKFLTVREAAKKMGVSKNYLYSNHHRLPFTRRFGRKLTFSSLGIDAYGASREHR